MGVVGVADLVREIPGLRIVVSSQVAVADFVAGSVALRAQHPCNRELAQVHGAGRHSPVGERHAGLLAHSIPRDVLANDAALHGDNKLIRTERHIDAGARRDDPSKDVGFRSILGVDPTVAAIAVVDPTDRDQLLTVQAESIDRILIVGREVRVVDAIDDSFGRQRLVATRDSR